MYMKRKIILNKIKGLFYIFLCTLVSVQCLCVFSRISFIDKGWREMLSMIFIFLLFFFFSGILFASLEGIDILSHTVFVPVSLEIFSSTENHWRGLIFMLAAVLFGFAFVLML